MNKRLYRTIFNKTRGLLMAVAENVPARGKQAGGNAPGGARSVAMRLRPACFSVLLSLGMVGTVGAQIVADPHAPKAQQPTVLNAGNGVPLVNIQAPSPAGVSHNTYSQFDVSQQGAILNNARTDTQTQLGGYVHGNPNLANGAAHVILNEVNSSDPSLLHGYVEVAGSRAQIVIANPSGISCDGCGIINASRVTLTTGTPVVNGGSLEGYRVQRGTVSISGDGLDASRADHTDIIARAVQVNAGIWAKELKVTAGANEVSADNSQAKPIEGDGPAPRFGIDVSALGGMYAGKITLVGTEAGVGVRNAGQIGASAGEVTVTADGILTNSGRITASTDVRLDTRGGIANSGTIYAQGNTKLATRGNIDNTGTVAAQGNTSIAATGAGSSVDSHAGAVIAAGVQPDGTLVEGGNVQVSATGQLTALGNNLAGGDLSLLGVTIDITGSQTAARNISVSAKSVDASRATISAAQAFEAQATDSLRTDEATVSAQWLGIDTGTLWNRLGLLLQTGMGTLSVRATRRLDNTGGTVSSSGDTDITVGDLTNLDGILAAGVALRVQASGTLDNAQGVLAANGSTDITAASVNNAAGQIGSVQGGTRVAATSGAIDNTAGRLEAAQTVTLSANGLLNPDGAVIGQDVKTDTHGQPLDNTRGMIVATGTLSIQAGQLTNDAGTLQAGTALSIDTHGQPLINRNSGDMAGILGLGPVTLQAGVLDNSTGFIGARGDITANAVQIINTQGGQFSGGQAILLAGAGLDNRGGSVQAMGNVTANMGAGSADNSGGLMRSGATLDIRAASVANTSTQGPDQGLEGQNVTLTADQINNQGGAIRADRMLTVTGSGTLDNIQFVERVADFPGFQPFQLRFRRFRRRTGWERDEMGQRTLPVIAGCGFMVVELDPYGTQDFPVFERFACLALRQVNHLLLRTFLRPLFQFHSGNGWVFARMRGNFVRLDIDAACRVAAGHRIRCVEQVRNRRLCFAVFVVFHQIRYQQGGKTPRTGQPVVGVDADQPGTKPCIHFYIRICAPALFPGTEAAWLKLPQVFVNPHIEVPDRVAALLCLRGGCHVPVDVGHAHRATALQAVVYQQVEIEDDHYGRMLFEHRQVAADACKQAEMISGIGGCQHMMADFMRQYLDRVVPQPEFGHGFEVDDNALVAKVNLRESARQPFLRRFGPVGTQKRVTQPGVFAPCLQCLRPCLPPAFRQLLLLGVFCFQ